MFIKIKTIDGSEYIINTDQIAYIEGNKINISCGVGFELQDESLKKLLLTISPHAKQVKNNTPDGDMLELFTTLHELSGGKGKPVFSLNREKKLKDLLDPKKHRMTREMLLKAAINIGNDPFLQGDNDAHKRYGDIDYLLRPDKAAKWAEDQQQKKKGMF